MRTEKYIKVGSIISIAIIFTIIVAASGKNKNIIEQNVSNNEVIDLIIPERTSTVTVDDVQVSSDSALPGSESVLLDGSPLTQDIESNSNIYKNSEENKMDINDVITISDDNGAIYTVIPGDESNSETPIIGVEQCDSVQGSTSSVEGDRDQRSDVIDNSTSEDDEEEVQVFETERIPLD